MATLSLAAVDMSRIYGDIWIQLTIPDVVPGQPVSFSWSNTTLAHRPLNLGTVTGRIYLLDANQNVPLDKDGNPIPIFTFPVTDRITPDPNGQPYVSPMYQFTPSDDQTRKALYRVGSDQILRLILTGSGPDKGGYSADAVLVVWAEPIDDTWWNWTVPGTRLVRWKQDKYPMNGTLINRSAYAIMTSCVVTLFEQDQSNLQSPPDQISPDQPAPSLVHGSPTRLTFASHDFSKSWQWLIEGLWVVNGAPQSKDFRYVCHLKFTDEFQNNYMEALSSSITVTVHVSDTKLASAFTAATLMEAAGVLLASAGLLFAAVITFEAAVALAGAATTAAAAAQVAGLAALDPPVPDERFRTPVEVSLPALPQNLTSRFPSLASILQSMGQMVGTLDALNQTESRLFTAISVGDAAAIKLQRDQYMSLESDLAAKGSVIQDEALNAAQAIDADPFLSASAIASGLAAWKQQSTHPEILKAWVDAGSPQELFFQVDSAIRSGTLGSHSTTLGATLGTCAAWLHRVANEIHTAGLPFTGDHAGASTAGLAIAGSLVQIALAGHWKTTITLINTGTVPALARLNFFGDNGSPLVLLLSFPQTSPPATLLASTLDRTLNAGAGLVVEITGPDSAPTQVGWAQLLTNGNISCSANFRQQIGDHGSEAIVPLENRNARTYALWFDNTNGLSTGVALANLTTQTTLIEVIIRDDAGAISGSDTLSLPAQGHTSFNLADRFTLTTQRRGTIEFSTQQPGQIGVLGLSFNPQGGFTTVPALAV